MTMHDYYNYGELPESEPEIIAPPEKKLTADVIKDYTNSRLKADQIIEYIEKNFIVIPRNVDPLSFLQKAAIIKEVGSICAHGLGEKPCPVMTEAQHQKISNIYAYNPPNYYDEPDKDKQITPKIYPPGQSIDERMMGMIPDLDDN